MEKRQNILSWSRKLIVPVSAWIVSFSPVTFEIANASENFKEMMSFKLVC